MQTGTCYNCGSQEVLDAGFCSYDCRTAFASRDGNEIIDVAEDDHEGLMVDVRSKRQIRRMNKPKKKRLGIRV